MSTKEVTSRDSSTIKQSKAPLYISIAIIVGAIAAYFLVPSVNQFFTEAWNVLTSDDEQKVKDWVGQFGFGGPLVIIAAMTLQMFLLVIPTPLLMIVSVLAYGLIQMLWDRSDPNGYAYRMTDNPLPNTPPHEVLSIVALGDHQVTNWQADVKPILRCMSPTSTSWGSCARTSLTSPTRTSPWKATCTA